MPCCRRGAVGRLNPSHCCVWPMLRKREQQRPVPAPCFETRSGRSQHRREPLRVPALSSYLLDTARFMCIQVVIRLKQIRHAVGVSPANCTARSTAPLVERPRNDAKIAHNTAIRLRIDQTFKRISRADDADHEGIVRGARGGTLPACHQTLRPCNPQYNVGSVWAASSIRRIVHRGCARMQRYPLSLRFGTVTRGCLWEDATTRGAAKPDLSSFRFATRASRR